MQYDPPDLSAARVEAANALLTSLREVRDVLDRLQLAAAWVLDVYGDTADAETVRMLRIPGGPVRPGKPAVPPPAERPSERALLDFADAVADELMQDDRPHSVTCDESGFDQ